MNSFFMWSPLRSIQVFQRFGSAWIPVEKKNLLAESAATPAPRVAPFRRT